MINQQCSKKAQGQPRKHSGKNVQDRGRSKLLTFLLSEAGQCRLGGEPMRSPVSAERLEDRPIPFLSALSVSAYSAYSAVISFSLWSLPVFRSRSTAEGGRSLREIAFMRRSATRTITVCAFPRVETPRLPSWRHSATELSSDLRTLMKLRMTCARGPVYGSRQSRLWSGERRVCRLPPTAMPRFRASSQTAWIAGRGQNEGRR
jgi:hypothetical protein